MSTSSSNVTTIGEVNQRIATTYTDQSSSTTTNVVRDGGHYSSFQINAQAIYAHNGVHQPGPGSPNPAALKELYTRIADEALHNASTRRDAPRCHEGTRTRVQEDIFSWVDGDAKGCILRLEGPVGCGKSAILGTIADKLQNRGQLAAAFFFPADPHSPRERCDKSQFITTLAYQLIQHEGMQFMRHQVLSNIEKDPSVFKLHLREQLEVLVLKPLREQASQNQGHDPPQARHRAIIVDGFYECGPDPELLDQQNRTAIWESIQRNEDEVLAVLQQAAGEPLFPFHIIVSIRSYGRFQGGRSDSSTICLPAKYHPNADIELFLRHQLAAIQCRHPHLPVEWPGEDVIKTLVDRACGLFIYIAVVLRFLERPPKPPQVRLNIILEKADHAEVPIGASRSLYTPPAPPAPGFRRELVRASTKFQEPLHRIYARLFWSSSTPLLIVRWLSAFQGLEVTRGMETWFLHLVCESYEGEANLLFDGTSGLVRAVNPRDKEEAEYTLYHPSLMGFFLRYEKPMHLDRKHEVEAREMWLVGQFILAFRNKGPQVPLTSSESDQLPLFCRTLIRFWQVLMRKRPSEGIQYYDEDLLACDPDWWLPFADLKHEDGRGFTQLLYGMAHAQCEREHTCRPECARWRDPIRKLWREADPSVIDLLPKRPASPSPPPPVTGDIVKRRRHELLNLSDAVGGSRS